MAIVVLGLGGYLIYDKCIKKDKDVTNKETKSKVKAIQPLSRLSLEFKSRVSDLIGLHKNIVAIIQWSKPEREDEVAQLIGRCLRLNNFGNKLYFYITTSSTEFE